MTAIVNISRSLASLNRYFQPFFYMERSFVMKQLLVHCPYYVHLGITMSNIIKSQVIAYTTQTTKNNSWIIPEALLDIAVSFSSNSCFSETRAEIRACSSTNRCCSCCLNTNTCYKM